MPKKATPDKMIKAWLLAQQDFTFTAIGEKLKCNNDTASRWVREVEATPKLLAEAKKRLPPGSKVKTIHKGNGRPPKKKAKLIQAASNLADENAFLRWWNTGERQGFVSRLLDELEK